MPCFVARAGDFSPPSQPITFPRNTLSYTFNLSVIDDNIIENSEDFEVILAATSTGTIDTTRNSAQVGIIDNDGKMSIQIIPYLHLKSALT